RPGARPPGAHRRSPGGRGAAAPRAGGVPRGGRGAVRLLHARPGRRRRGPPGARTGAGRGRGAGGALGQPLPLHRIREDPRRRADRVRAHPRRRGVSVLTGARTRGGVGESVRRVDGAPKVKGAFAFASDLFAEGMLWGYTLRCPHPSARVRSIDISTALVTPGVHAVLLAADVPGKKTYGLEFADQPVLAHDRARYAGEPVAVLGGVDLYVATQWLHVDRQQIAPCLALPPDKVRLHLAGVGGAFGAREDVSMHIHACLLALRTRRPVKMSYGRAESFFGHVHRHPS